MEFRTTTGTTRRRRARTPARREPARMAASRRARADAERARLEPAAAAMAILSRCANYTLSQHVETAYRAAAQARDCARAAATAAERDYPPGPARDALVATWARQEADAESLMRAVLRFAREHGHLAFAFSVYS